MINCRLILFLLYPVFWDSSSPTELTIHFENVRSEEGYILLGIYQDEESWSNRTPIREHHVAKDCIVNGKLTLNLNSLKPGNYGIAFLDDENGNERVDMGFIFPKEGFGFSNYYHSSLLPPRFRDFTFNFPEKKDIHVRFRYLKD